MKRTTAAALFLIAACGGTPDRPLNIAPRPDDVAEAVAEPPPPAEEPPLGRLPSDVSPRHYTLALRIVPTEERFSGTARIDLTLTRPRRVIWLHGEDLAVAAVTLTPATGEPITEGWEWEQVNEDGVVALRLPREVPAGEASLEVTYDAPFDRHLRGLYRVDERGESYAFTQFESISARLAFPGFDEPAFKVPFDVTITTRRDLVAAGNTPVVEETPIADGMKQVRFATTRPIPTYLVAWAVGPLDVVDVDPIPPNDVRQRPVPLRGIAVKGRGEQLAYALAHTPEIVAALERYFGIEYPYKKLDIVAVPDFGAGAMENVGLITFRESLLLVGDDAPEWQHRAYAYVMAHELSHQWFGNLVTMPWWDDIWLNEAFATWMGSKITGEVFPEYHSDIGLLESMQRAMRSDSLVSARQIRQPIESSHDIRNAFDSITYSKGGGVLSMFERWITVPTFQQGIHHYLESHAWGNATADDLLAALSETAGRNVGTPFRTFLDQPGVPFLQTALVCDEGLVPRITVRQKRYFPVGSSGDAEHTWQVPVCVRFPQGRETHVTCALVDEAEDEIQLEGEACPRWYMPNADGAGYLRFSMSAEELGKLRRDGWRSLDGRERMAVADSMKASVEAGALPAAELLDAMGTLAHDDVRQVAEMPMSELRFARDRLVEPDHRDRVERMAQRLYGPTMRRLGLRPRPRENGEAALTRASVAELLAMTARDARVRRDLARLGREYVGYGGDGELHVDAVDPNLAGLALAVAVQEGDSAFFDALLNRLFETDDAVLRGRILGALGSTHDPELASRARSLSLDARLHVNEVTRTLREQLGEVDTRAPTWDWIEEHFQELTDRISDRGAGWLPWLAAGFCSEDDAARVEAFFQSRIDEMPGGPRNLAGTLEVIRLCAAQADAQRDSARSFFAH